MLAALMAGARDPQRLVTLALGKLRRTLADLALVLAGQVTDHHASIIQGALELIF